ncbi:hypothetical protein F9817_13070 [Vibrio sp. CAIM 722]|uniref:Uncharacterized protein n=1 Tax=Vibrio eleionomae TaxID=2653505 RepID=A0A7X4LLI1_9VIBR|nr:hypothetical protein [Vibrio eleionomae]MZI94124.1 hypothetical protein [Vibrio eleionomae]
MMIQVRRVGDQPVVKWTLILLAILLLVPLFSISITSSRVRLYCLDYPSIKNRSGMAPSAFTTS